MPSVVIMVQMRMVVVCVALVGHFNIHGRGEVSSIHCIESLEQPPSSTAVPFLAFDVLIVVEVMAKFAASVITR